ncbi:carboxypeptidase regulatory-like domain-containing protein [Geomonas sp. Red32]|uniref:MSCRAMM family protein n=1 Tax=Geomonas sp. Red32 TaxID=2912856 RepID=UPI00202CB916|nr:carboxypeptidase-like regulatory domain-containing protein [Geomonas sp. Red32]MCM0082547.1 carboxypeptidase regulatory-like domain-containing protein [Geomonas sp. Red32]
MRKIIALVFILILPLIFGCGGSGGSGVTGTSAPAAYSIAGQVTLNGAGLGQVTLAVNGVGNQFSDGNGNFSFTQLSNGSYTVTPSRAGYTFTPASVTVSINNNGAAADFTAVPIPTYSISGTVSSGNNAGLAGATVTITDASSQQVASLVTDGAGHYAAAGLTAGSYHVAVSHPDGFSFSPSATQTVTLSGASQTADFTAAAAATYAISGSVSVSGGGALAGVSLVLADQAGASYRTTTGANGAFSFAGIPDGYYTMTPALSGYNFVPNPLLVHVNGQDNTGNAISASSANSGSGAITVTL